MELTDLLLGFILVLAALFVLIALIRPDLLEAFSEAGRQAFTRTGFPGTVEVIGEPQINIRYPDNLEGVYNYEISFRARLEYKGDFSKFGEKVGFIDIVPLISYKGMEQKALAEDELGQLKPYLRIKEERVYDKTISTSITSKEPPIEKIGNPYVGEMNKSQIFLMEDKGQFLVELDSVESTVFEDILCKDFKVGRLCEPICWAFLSVKCISKGIETKSERLKGGCDASDTSECEQLIRCGEGSVYVNVMKTDCGKDRAELEISADGGKSSEEKLGEEMEISFWHKNDCVDKEQNYKDLRVKCVDDYLGGPYKFKYVPEYLLSD